MQKLLLSGLLLLPLLVHAQGGGEPAKAYRWVDKGGAVHFSSSPPPPGTQATEIELRQPQTVIHQDSVPQLLERGKAAGERADNRQQARERLLVQIEALKVELERANEAYSQGESPQSGERRHIKGGGSRLSEVYHQRREAESRQIEQLQLQLDDLYEQYNKLR